MYLTLDPPCRQAFLAALSAQAAPSFSLRLKGHVLELIDVSHAQAGWALSHGAFPVHEAGLMRGLIRRRFTFFDRKEQRELLTLARVMAGCDVYRCTPASGPGRLARLSGLLERELKEQGRLDLSGFCRFRLPGYRSYLLYLLEMAASELIAVQEEEEFRQLLRDEARPLPESKEWRLEFLPCGAFQLSCEELAEGGRWQGREDALIADLISRRPSRLQLAGLAYAPLAVTAHLEQALGDRLDYALPENGIDKGADKC